MIDFFKILVIFYTVKNFFKNDMKKTILWFEEKNPLLGTASPFDLISIGRLNKVYDFVMNSMEEYGNTLEKGN